MSIDPRKIVVEKLRQFGETWKEPDSESKAGPSEGKVGAGHDPTDPYKNPLKFLFGVVFDQGIDYEKAWEDPSELERRLGHLDLIKISKMKQEELAAILAKYPALHRFNNKMAGWLISASGLLLTKYDGRAENVWKGKPTVRTLESRFREFEGIKQKKGSMAVNILVRDYRLPISGNREGIDVSYDIHVRKVFLRSGLAANDTEDEIVGAARELNPDYPGELDYPAWVIGRYWCHGKNPECSKCVLDIVCPKNFRNIELPKE